MKQINLIKTLFIVSPLFLMALVAGVISMTDIKNAAVVTRVKIETLLLFFGLLSTIVWTIIAVFKAKMRSIQTQVEKQQQQTHREEHQRFIQRLDHELKNPLTAIQLGLENLAPQIQSNGQKNPLKEIQTQTRRLSQLTNDLRKLAAFDDQKLEFEEVNIGDLLIETKELAADLTDQRQLQLILPAAPWPVPNIRADRDLLQLALYNVIENAVKYSNIGDHVDIRASDDQDWVKIEIADTGLGIANKDVNKVWEELFRGQNGRDRKGTGIGLSLVKRIIERHDGSIHLESKENTGTRVTLALPISGR